MYRKIKTASGLRLRFHPYPAVVQLHYLAAMGQADAGALVFGPGMQAPEQQEDFIVVRRLYADTVVLTTKRPVINAPFRADMYFGDAVLFRKLNGVAQQVLEQ